MKSEVIAFSPNFNSSVISISNWLQNVRTIDRANYNGEMVHAKLKDIDTGVVNKIRGIWHNNIDGCRAVETDTYFLLLTRRYKLQSLRLDK